MCGITGLMYFSEHKISVNEFTKFNNTLSHRGPDGNGIYITPDNKLGLGHRRLAILDLSETGRQPMSYLDGRYQITYNGEIYNFIELRKELLDCGYKFRSDSDTEVIMAAFDKWGSGCLDKFNGMWAFAIWDNRNRELFLARDRFGIKPLYYTFLTGELFAFSSETSSFKYLNYFKKEIDERNLVQALQAPFSLEGFGKTIYKNINQILPGHYIELSKHGGAIIQNRWWNTTDHLVQVPELYDDQVKEFYDLFADACRIRMRSDVSLGTALSGGLDSSSVYCTLQNIMKSNIDKTRIPRDWQRAFSAVFPGTSIDEKSYAKQVVESVNGSAEYIEPEYSNLVEELISSTTKFDSIYLSPVSVAGNIYRAMRNKGLKISMDGHGVDEMLFGYPDMVAEAYYDALRRGDEEYARDLLDIYLGMQLPENQSEALRNISTNSDRAHLFARKLFQVVPFAKIMYNFARKKNRFLWLYSPDTARDGSRGGLNDLVYNMFHETTLPTILRNFDRVSMQQGVEIRMPFLDWRLVTYVFSLPLKSKLEKGFTKRILRDSMRGVLPEEIRTRKLKIGMNAPMKEWFSNELKQYILDEVSTKSFLSSNIWNGQKIKMFVEGKMLNQSWSWADCVNFWPYLNAQILITNN